MYFTGDFRYHFDTDKEGHAVVAGARDERIAHELGEARKRLQNASGWNAFRIGLQHIGRALHPLQDKYSHNAKHMADIPFNHAPKTMCTVLFQDPNGTKEPMCIRARQSNPNWNNEHRPDWHPVRDNPIWRADHDAALQATLKVFKDFSELTECYCKR